MLHYFADVKYKDPTVLGQSFQLTIDSLLKPDEEVPVKVSNNSNAQCLVGLSKVKIGFSNFLLLTDYLNMKIIGI